MRITLIEDKLQLAGFLSRALTREGHLVTTARSFVPGRPLPGPVADLLVIDAAMVSAAVPRQLLDYRVPVFCLRTGRAEGQGAWELDGGGLDALVPRLSQDEAGVTAGDLSVDPRARRASWRGATLPLSGHDLCLLGALARAAGDVVSRSTLLLEVWQTSHDPGTNVVDVAVSHLRHRLRDAGADVRIECVRGLGYRLATSIAAAA